MQVTDMQKLMINIWMIMKKIKYHHINYWDVNNLSSWALPQKLPVNNFEWNKGTSQFNKDFIKNYDEEL